ncbi:MAG: hypothetical protein GPJ51_13260 [Candidatus Heimdallarchaeota archaeon]|nr:hypothetical protein [Candidatus Heimdallarchaeota archaeon]
MKHKKIFTLTILFFLFCLSLSSTSTTVQSASIDEEPVVNEYVALTSVIVVLSSFGISSTHVMKLG